MKKLAKPQKSPRVKRVYVIIDTKTGTLDHDLLFTSKREAAANATTNGSVAEYEFMKFVGTGSRSIEDA